MDQATALAVFENGHLDGWGPLKQLAEHLHKTRVRLAEIDAELLVRLDEISAAYSAFDQAQADEVTLFNRNCELADSLAKVAIMSNDPALISKASEMLIAMFQSRPQLMAAATEFANGRFSSFSSLTKQGEH